MADASADWIERGKEYVAAKWAKFTENWLDMEEWETDDSDVEHSQETEGGTELAPGVQVPNSTDQ